MFDRKFRLIKRTGRGQGSLRKGQGSEIDA